MNSTYFIVLNYNTAEETKNCIESIRRLEGKGIKKKIVLIDNCSLDESFQKLQEAYCDDRDVLMYQMSENLGFSKANNYGYNVVREKGDADFCIVCNSDILFTQLDFLTRLEREYKRSNFYICGPDIFCKARQNSPFYGRQSPMYPFEWKKCYVKAYFLYNQLMYKRLKREKCNIFKVAMTHMLWLYWRCRKTVCMKAVYYNYRKKRHENVPVHGSCIILSTLFMEKEKKLFEPETEFYGEELLLYLKSKKNNYKIVFNPEMVVEHLQGKATSTVKSGKERDLFRYEHYMAAARTYLEELKGK